MLFCASYSPPSPPLRLVFVVFVLPIRHIVQWRCLEKRKPLSEQSTMNYKRKIVKVSLLTPFSLWLHKLKLSGNNFLIDHLFNYLTATLSGTEDVEREGDLLSFVGQVRVKGVSQYYTPNVHITIICPYFNYLYRSCTYEIKESNLRPRSLSLLPLQSGEILSRSFLCLISDGIWPPFEYFFGSLLLLVLLHVEPRNILDATGKKRRKFKIRAMDCHL